MFVLNFIEQIFNVFGDAFERARFFRKRVAPRNFDRAVFEIAHSDAEPDGNALQFVFGKFLAGFILSLSSYLTEIPSAFNSSKIGFTFSEIFARSSSFGRSER